MATFSNRRPARIHADENGLKIHKMGYAMLMGLVALHEVGNREFPDGLVTATGDYFGLRPRVFQDLAIRGYVTEHIDHAFVSYAMRRRLSMQALDNFELIDNPGLQAQLKEHGTIEKMMSALRTDIRRRFREEERGIPPVRQARVARAA